MNTVAIIGRLGKDPELKYTQSGKAVTTLSVAVDAGRDEIAWVNVVCWEKTAEAVCEHLSKGAQVGIEGRLQTRQWQTNDGQQREVLEVVAHRVDFCGSKRDGEQRSGPKQQRSHPAPDANASLYDEDSDDDPFADQ